MEGRGRGEGKGGGGARGIMVWGFLGCGLGVFGDWILDLGGLDIGFRGDLGFFFWWWIFDLVWIKGLEQVECVIFNLGI